MGLNCFAILVCFIKCIVVFAEELLNMMTVKGTTFIWSHLTRDGIMVNALLHLSHLLKNVLTIGDNLL